MAKWEEAPIIGGTAVAEQPRWASAPIIGEAAAQPTGPVAPAIPAAVPQPEVRRTTAPSYRVESGPAYSFDGEETGVPSVITPEEFEAEHKQKGITRARGYIKRLGLPEKAVKSQDAEKFAKALYALEHSDGDMERAVAASPELEKEINAAAPYYSMGKARRKREFEAQRPELLKKAEWYKKGSIEAKENFERNWKSLVPMFDVAKGVALKGAFDRLAKNEYEKETFERRRAVSAPTLHERETGEVTGAGAYEYVTTHSQSADWKLVDEYLTNMAEESERGKTWGAKWSMGLAHTGVWMAEFMATSGLGNLVKAPISAGAKKLLRKSVNSALKRGLIKATARLTSWLAVAGARAVALPHHALKTYYEESLPKGFVKNKDGSLTVTKEGKTGIGAMLQAYQGAVISFAAEESGQAITIAITKIPGVRKLAKATFNKLSIAWSKSSKSVSKYDFITSQLKKAGYSNLFGEMAEEQAERILRKATGLGGKVFPTLEEFSLELAILSVPTAGRAALVHGSALIERLQGHEEAEDYDNMLKYAEGMMEKGFATAGAEGLDIPADSPDAVWEFIARLSKEGKITPAKAVGPIRYVWTEGAAKYGLTPVEGAPKYGLAPAEPAKPIEKPVEPAQEAITPVEPTEVKEVVAPEAVERPSTEKAKPAKADVPRGTEVVPAEKGEGKEVGIGFAWKSTKGNWEILGEAKDKWKIGQKGTSYAYLVPKNEISSIIKKDAANITFAEKQQKAKDKKAAEEERLMAGVNEFVAGKDVMAQGRMKKTLTREMLHNGKTTSRRELVEDAVRDGAKVVTKKGNRLLTWPDESVLFQSDITKTAMDYAEHLLAKPAQAPAAKEVKPAEKGEGKEAELVLSRKLAVMASRGEISEKLIDKAREHALEDANIKRWSREISKHRTEKGWEHLWGASDKYMDVRSEKIGNRSTKLLNAYLEKELTKPALPAEGKEVWRQTREEYAGERIGFGKAIKTDRGAIVDARKDVKVGDYVIGTHYIPEERVGRYEVGKVVKVLKKAVDIEVDGEKIRLNSKIGVLSKEEVATIKKSKRHRKIVKRAIKQGKIESHPDYPDLMKTKPAAKPSLPRHAGKLRKLARERGIDVSDIKGKGAVDRLIERIGEAEAERGVAGKRIRAAKDAEARAGRRLTDEELAAAPSRVISEKGERIFSKKGYDEAMGRLGEGKKLFGGVPVPTAQEIKDAAFVVMYHVENGVRKLSDILQATAGKIDPKVVRKAWRATRDARREYAIADKLGKPVVASRVNKLVRTAVEAGIPKVEKKRLVLSIKAWLRGWKRGELELAEVHSNLVGIVQENLPLSQHGRYAKKIAKAGTAAQLNAVSRQISKAIEKERIVAGAELQKAEAVREEIITTPAKMLRNVMKREQIVSAKAYLAGAKDVVANHAELMEYAEEKLGKDTTNRLFARIAKTRTPRQRQLAVAAIDILADKAEKKAAFDELRVEIKSLDLKKMPDPQAEQIRDLLDTFTLSEPADKTLARARKILSAAERSDLGEVPQALITRAEMYLERAEKTPVGKLPTESIREITQALITLAHAASTKNQLFFTRKHGNAKEAVATATQEVAEKHGAKYQTETGEFIERRVQNLLAKIATSDQLSLETKAYVLGGAESATYDLLHESLHKGDNQRIATARKSVEHIQAKMKELGLEAKDLEAFSRIMSRKAKIQTIELPTATDTKGRRVKKVKMTKAERMTLLAHFADSETRRELLRNKQKGITFARARGREAINLRIADIEAIRQSATPTEIALVELGMEICNSDTYLRGALNEAWYAEFGWKLAKRSDYWHRQRDYEYRKESRDPNVVMQQWIDRMLEQQGRFKKRGRSNDPIVVGDFFVELMTHINRVSAFVGKGRATQDAMRLLQDRGFRNTVRDAYKYGDSLLSDIEKTVKDYRGLDVRPLEPVERGIRWMIRRIHVGALGLKPHIVAYQTVSLINASNEIIIPAKAAPLALKKAFRAEMRKRSQQIWVRHHASAHQILTPGSAAISAEAFFGGKEGGLIERGAMGLIHEADMGVIYTISAAAHLEGQKKGLTGEELWDYTVHKAEQVISRTQPTWDVLTTSSIHRAARANPAIKLLATMFSSQRNKNLNMTVKAASDLGHEAKTAKNIGNAFRKLAVPTIVNAVSIAGIQYGWNAVLGGIGSLLGIDRDDDDDKGRGYLMTVLNRFFGNWLIVGDIISSVSNAVAKGIKGESTLFVGRRGDPIHEAANDAIRGAGELAKAIGQAARDEVHETGEFKGEKKATRTFIRAAERSARAMGMITGKPVSGILQVYKGITGRKRPSDISKAAKAIMSDDESIADNSIGIVLERWRKYEKTQNPDWSRGAIERKVTKDMRSALYGRSKWDDEETKPVEHWEYLVKVDKFLPPIGPKGIPRTFEYMKTKKVTAIIVKSEQGKDESDKDFSVRKDKKAVERKDYFAYLKAAKVDLADAEKLLRAHQRKSGKHYISGPRAGLWTDATEIKRSNEIGRLKTLWKEEHNGK